VQDPITRPRASLVGTAVDVLVDGEDEDGLVGRTSRGAREIDGIVRIMEAWAGRKATVRCADRRGRLDLEASATTASARRFGQGAVAPANFVTVARLLVAVPTLLLIRDRSGWLTVGLWFAITSTDSLDGWLARRDGATRSGAFLDPVTDKAIVLGGLAVLADRGDFPWWPVVVIAIREIGISLYRSLAGRRGIVLPAQRLGKYKAFLQYCSVGLVLLPITEHWYTFQDIVLYAAVAFTVVSGLAILRHGWSDFQQHES
jgi:CDP-diacylglycerol--glycerol-3-phosphate 3-phosphatidyltransferase